jgi:hypothetical protein
MRTYLWGALVLILSVALLSQCGPEKEQPEENPQEETLPENEFKSVPLGDPGIPGFSFPTPETSIDNWVYADPMMYDSIYYHSWGLWMGMTMQSGEKLDGEPLRVFETWLDKGSMKELVKRQMDNPDLKAIHIQRGRGALNLPRQHQHFGNDVPFDDARVVEFVKYNPEAEEYAVSNKLFLASTYDNYLKEGYEELPGFPATAITVKPVWYALDSNRKVGENLYAVDVWPGPNQDSINAASGYAPSSWNNVVYINTAAGASSNEKDTFTLKDFIHFQLDSVQAAGLRAATKESPDASSDAKAGDYAVLVGMHTTSKETKRWVWQSFWWSKTPDTPNFPSLQAIADARPDKLKNSDDASAHYAMTVAYSMVEPAQPVNGGQSVGKSLYAYNPYLEAPFYPAEFSNRVGKVGSQLNKVGMQSNCISCHMMATYSNAGSGNENNLPGYIPNAYYPLDAPFFKGTLKLDFAWSLTDVIKEENAAR